jgi:hypothetical protein
MCITGLAVRVVTVLLRGCLSVCPSNEMRLSVVAGAPLVRHKLCQIHTANKLTENEV